MVAGIAFYGPIASWVLRSKVFPKVSQKLQRNLSVGEIDVWRGQVRLEDVVVSGQGDGDRPLARISEVWVDFDFWSSLRGEVSLGDILISAPNVVLRKDASGKDNFSDILKRLKRDKNKENPETGNEAKRADARISLEKIKVEKGRIEVHDEENGVTLISYDVGAHIDAERMAIVTVGEAAGLSSFGPHVKVTNAKIDFSIDDPTHTISMALEEGESRLWDGMVLTGIKGTLAQAQNAPGNLIVKLDGSYGGSKERLWSVDGTLNPKAKTGRLELEAESFTFDKLAPILLENPYIQDFDDTTLNANALLEVRADKIQLNGDIDLAGLTVEHPMLASEPVVGISVNMRVDAEYLRQSKVLNLRDLNLRSGQVELQIVGELALAGGIDEVTKQPREHQRLKLSTKVPTVRCQEVLNAIPKGLAPVISGFRLSGNFRSDISVEVDWGDLESTRVFGGVGIDGCKVLSSPRKLSAKRLEGTFRHQVLIGEDEYRPLKIGPENPDFVPIEEISPYLPMAFVTREDATFYSHKGFINREFKTAIVKNLVAGRFAYGASSITMQTVKNVLLSREKTISRKLQELFLTWYIETQLEKDRIMEIYVNAIEFGPGLYGVGPAANVYFGKDPRDLNLMESAFLATLLPSPRTYYKQFCTERIFRSIDRKIWKTLEFMLDRELITEEQFLLGRTAPLEFSQEKRVLCRKGGYQP